MFLQCCLQGLSSVLSCLPGSSTETGHLEYCCTPPQWCLSHQGDPGSVCNTVGRGSAHRPKLNPALIIRLQCCFFRRPTVSNNTGPYVLFVACTLHTVRGTCAKGKCERGRDREITDREPLPRKAANPHEHQPEMGQHLRAKGTCMHCSALFALR